MVAKYDGGIYTFKVNGRKGTTIWENLLKNNNEYTRMTSVMPILYIYC